MKEIILISMLWGVVCGSAGGVEQWVQGVVSGEADSHIWPPSFDHVSPFEYVAGIRRQNCVHRETEGEVSWKLPQRHSENNNTQPTTLCAWVLYCVTLHNDTKYPKQKPRKPQRRVTIQVNNTAALRHPDIVVTKLPQVPYTLFSKPFYHLWTFAV